MMRRCNVWCGPLSLSLWPGPLHTWYSSCPALKRIIINPTDRSAALFHIRSNQVPSLPPRAPQVRAEVHTDHRATRLRSGRVVPGHHLRSCQIGSCSWIILSRSCAGAPPRTLTKLWDYGAIIGPCDGSIVTLSTPRLTDRLHGLIHQLLPGNQVTCVAR